MNDYDKAARFAAKRLDPLGFLLWLLGVAFGRAWKWRGWLDTQAVPFPGEPDRRCDTVARFTRRDKTGPPLAVVVEFMSETRRAILERLVSYEMSVRFEVPYQRSEPKVLYDVIGVVVNLTGTRLEGQWSMTPIDCGGLGLWSMARVLNLETMDARTVLSGIASGKIARCVLVWLPLMEGGNELRNIGHWKRLAEQEPDVEKRRLYAALALIFAGKVGSQDVWKKSMEGWQVLRSPITLEWEAFGRLETTREKLLQALKLRIGKRVPTDIVRRVQAEENQAVLDGWFNHAVLVPTFDEMRAAMNSPQP